MIFNYFMYIWSILLAFSVCACVAIGNKQLVVLNTGLEEITPSTVALQLFVALNNTGKNDLEVSLVPDQCCLDVGREEFDCNVVEPVGSTSDIIPSGKSKSLKLIAPLADPFERQGYCVAFVDSKISGRSKHVMRDTVKIPIDTRVKVQAPRGLNVKPCDKIDQDPLNHCQPVNCLRYYNGRKSYFNKIVQKCMEVPPCISNKHTEMPETIYDPIKNECVNDNPVSREDIAFIKTIVHGGRTPKDIVIIKNYKSLDKTPNITDLIYKDDTLKKVDNPDYKVASTTKILAEKVEKPKQSSSNGCKPDTCIRKLIFDYLLMHRWALSCLILLVVLQCGLIGAMIYYLTGACFCRKKKLIRQYFNYRQDASITTPLIATSNMETETTDFQYLSDTSNNAVQKIKSYKACQKDNQNNVQMSLSDDILSKCLNRRDWQHTSVKSDAIHNFTTEIYKDPQKTLAKCSTFPEERNKGAKTTDNINTQKKPVQVSYENENFNTKSSKRISVKDVAQKLEKRASSKSKKSVRTNLNDSDIVYSEQEIQCHSYNFMHDAALRKPSSCSLTGFKPSQIKTQGYVKLAKKASSSLSTDKSAQACFTNDSIDDILSERVRAGDNISKYSFSSSSNTRSISSLSSKTSKNNMVKNVLSALLHRKSKNAPLSDPGGKKSKESVDLEIIHMSHGTVYSSANESDLKLKKEYMLKKNGNNSRTSR